VTFWWGVDRRGQLARFSAGSRGVVPERTEPTHALSALIEHLVEPRAPELELWRLGAFAYSAEALVSELCMPYLREPPPEHRLLLSERPGLRELLRPVELLHADFELEVLWQPYEHGEGDIADAWVGSTGRLHEDELGPEDDSEEVELPELEAESAPVALLAGYLSGDPQASAVLADWRAERGLVPLGRWPEPARRLDDVLFYAFGPTERRRLEARLVEHVMGKMRLSLDTRTRAGAVLAAVRQGQEGRPLDPPEPTPDDITAGQLAWALWALERDLPLVAARTARELAPHQLHFQLRAVLDALSG
jgi:hypothetical protein